MAVPRHLMQMVTSESDRRTFGLGDKLLQANLPELPFPHLLRSNKPPTESESRVLRDVITIAEEEESRLEEMLSNQSGSDRHALKTVKGLTHECSRAHQFIVEHNTVLSSIRQLPPEILENIFIHTLPTTVTPGPWELSASPLPWALSHVCQHWRRIMLSFSAMWRNLPIVNLTRAHTTKKRYLDLLTELLKRSHNMPIRLTVVRGSDEDIGHPAIELFVLHSDRWQEIKINGSFAFLSAFKNIKGRLSSLQSLYLHLYYSGPIADSVNYAVHDLFHIAPQLRHVDFHGPPCELLFPAHQLVHYSQQGPYLEQAIQVMASSSSLRNLQFNIHQVTTENTLPMRALRLPNLAVLDASFPESSAIFELFMQNITTPALQELVIKIDIKRTITHIRSLILRSGCLLRVLHLEVSFAQDELQSLLRLTPLVTKLTVILPNFIQDISALVFDGNTPPLLPLLDQCEFLRSDRDEFVWAEYEDFYLSMGSVQAIKLLASSRCELPGNNTSGETPLFNNFHPLQTLRISLGWKSTLYRQHFEGWVMSDMANELYKHHQRLLGLLPELIERCIFFERTFYLKWKSEVTDLLTHLETLQIEKASDICMSGIQYILYAISDRFREGSRKFSFSLIARRILDKWEPILRNDMPNLRWHCTVSYLKYLSPAQNQALRSSPDAVKFFYYGLDAEDLSADYIALYGQIVEGMDLNRS